MKIQKYKVLGIKIRFFNYIFLRAIMVKTGRYTYNKRGEGKCYVLALGAGRKPIFSFEALPILIHAILSIFHKEFIKSVKTCGIKLVIVNY